MHERFMYRLVRASSRSGWEAGLQRRPAHRTDRRFPRRARRSLRWSFEGVFSRSSWPSWLR